MLILGAILLCVVGFVAYYFLSSSDSSGSSKYMTNLISDGNNKKNGDKEEVQPDDGKKIRPAQVDPNEMKYGPVKVYFASQTGGAEQFAHDFTEEAKSHLIWCQPTNLRDLDVTEQ